jgi:hypothetical protein
MSLHGHLHIPQSPSTDPYSQMQLHISLLAAICINLDGLEASAELCRFLSRRPFHFGFELFSFQDLRGGKL